MTDRYYTVKQSMQMIDVSLSYSNIYQDSGEQLKATVWVDSELADARQCMADASYFSPSGAELGTERVVPVPRSGGIDAVDGFQVPAATALKLSQLKYAPPEALEGDVVVVRLALRCVADGRNDTLVATNDYTFGIRRAPPPPAPVKGCNVEVGYDWHPDVGTVVAASDAAACCAACEAKSGCKVGVLFGSDCYLKTAAQAVTKYPRAGRTSCSPKPDTLTSTATELLVSRGSASGGPLHAMLAVPKTSLSLTVAGTSSAPVLRIANANISGSPCALYVKPSLRNATGYQLGYTSFSSGFVILRPGEATTIKVLSTGAVAGAAVTACAEAWNAPRVCTGLRNYSDMQLE